MECDEEAVAALSSGLSLPFSSVTTVVVPAPGRGPASPDFSSFFESSGVARRGARPLTRPCRWVRLAFEPGVSPKPQTLDWDTRLTPWCLRRLAGSGALEGIPMWAELEQLAPGDCSVGDRTWPSSLVFRERLIVAGEGKERTKEGRLNWEGRHRADE